MSDGLLWGQPLLSSRTTPLRWQKSKPHFVADADVVATDQARGAILAERPFLSAAVLGEPASSERRAIVRRLRERNVPFLFCGPNPPDAITSDGAPFIANAAAREDVVRALAFLISVQRPSR